LLTADLVGLSAAFLVAQEVYAASVAGAGDISRFTEFVTFALCLPVWVVAAKLYGLYDKDEERTDHSTADDFARLFHLITVCTFLLYAGSHLTRWFNPGFSKLFLFWLLAIGGTVALRGGARAYCRRRIQYLQNTIIVGAGEVGQTIARKVLHHPEYGINLVGFVDGRPKVRTDDLEHLTILGDMDDVEALVELLDVERVIIAFSAGSHPAELALIRRLRGQDLQIDIVPRLFDTLGPNVNLHELEGIALIGLPPAKLSTSSAAVKRVVDMAVAALALLVLTPAILLVALAIKCESKGPVFYRHRRLGRAGRPLALLKFRTMHLAYCRGADYGGETAEIEFEKLLADPVRRQEFERSYKLQHDPRVTRVGRLLRRTSIDELPQLFNVLTGKLSLVGPRALTDEEIDQYYGVDRGLLLGIRPGLTGYWQINGRSQLAYEDRVRLDLAYISGWSPSLDFLILMKTIRVLVSGRGAY
jgi:exopolysaccharide biosynthesis polyprenyl glycosylphosphotransferase